MSKPSVATIKHLFAVSANKCAFPKCTQPLVDAASGKVVGRVCHIKAASPTGPRYDKLQSDEERHGFANLILMCPVHHDVIDSDVDSYTVERLTTLKNQHENHHVQLEDLPESVARQFITNISNNRLTNGSIVYSVNQSGGQIAHSITNVGPQPRSLSLAPANDLIERLKLLPPQRYEVTVVAGDVEASRLGHQIDNMLSWTNWTTTGFVTHAFPQHMTGLTISFPAENEAVKLLVDLFVNSQFQPKLEFLPSLDKVHILVGSQI